MTEDFGGVSYKTHRNWLLYAFAAGMYAGFALFGGALWIGGAL
ncbi:MAG: hypothetical protein AAF360_02730 [Pseudomonadota bacterium]